jgi:predicted RNase H-like HicB family nuclease
MAKRKVYTAQFELGENGYWAVTADVGPGKSAISDGQTLPKARRRIRQSIALLLEIDARSFDIHEEYGFRCCELPDGALEERPAQRIRDLIGSVEGLPADLASNSHYLVDLGVRRV